VRPPLGATIFLMIVVMYAAILVLGCARLFGLT
jgi:hypothetical protein